MHPGARHEGGDGAWRRSYASVRSAQSHARHTFAGGICGPGRWDGRPRRCVALAARADADQAPGARARGPDAPRAARGAAVAGRASRAQRAPPGACTRRAARCGGRRARSGAARRDRGPGKRRRRRRVRARAARGAAPAAPRRTARARATAASCFPRTATRTGHGAPRKLRELAARALVELAELQERRRGRDAPAGGREDPLHEGATAL